MQGAIQVLGFTFTLPLIHHAYNPVAEQNKNSKWSKSPYPVGKEKIYGGKDLPKSQVLRSECKTERVRENECGDSEDGEDENINRSD